MKITQVSYSRLANLGNYSNERIELTATITDQETPEEAIAALKGRLIPMLGQSEMRLEQHRNNLYREIRALEERLSKAKQTWETAATFMKAQGLKTDAPDFPDVTIALLPGGEEERFEVIDAESDEDEDDDIPI